MSFVCPRCNAESHHPKDKEYGWCSRCQAYTGRERQTSLRESADKLSGYASANRSAAELAHACYIMERRTVGASRLAKVAEEASRTAATALRQLAHELRDEARAFEPPPGPHDNCPISCGPECDAP